MHALKLPIMVQFSFRQELTSIGDSSEWGAAFYCFQITRRLYNHSINYLDKAKLKDIHLLLVAVDHPIGKF